MKEIKIGNVELTLESQDTPDPYIVGMFGKEGTGKTRFVCTGPERVAVIPLERKTYLTIEKYEKESGRRILRPKNPELFLANPRKSSTLEALVRGAKNDSEKEKANLKLREHYRDFVNRINDTVYGLLDNSDVRLLAIDTFGQYVNLVDSALYGCEDKFIKVEGKLYKDRREFNQEIIDFLNSLSAYRKHVVLTHKCKDEYKGANATGRMTFEGFKFLGNHVNVTVEMESNPKWNPSSDDENRLWHWQMNVRTCQANPVLEGPDGNPLCRDEMITYANLIMSIDPEASPEDLM